MRAGRGNARCGNGGASPHRGSARVRAMRGELRRQCVTAWSQCSVLLSILRWKTYKAGRRASLGEPSDWKIYNADQLAVLRLGCKISANVRHLQVRNFARVHVFAFVLRKSRIMNRLTNDFRATGASRRRGKVPRRCDVYRPRGACRWCVRSTSCEGPRQCPPR